MAQLVYDVTVRFCDRYISKRSRIHDPMVQAARSGVQNIAEGSKASGTSKKTEIKLARPKLLKRKAGSLNDCLSEGRQSGGSDEKIGPGYCGQGE